MLHLLICLLMFLSGTSALQDGHRSARRLNEKGGGTWTVSSLDVWPGSQHMLSVLNV